MMEEIPTSKKKRVERRKGVQRRTPELVRKSYRSNLAPTLASLVGVQLILIVDSVFAGFFVGERAIAAIAMFIPFQLFDEVLHDLLVSGMFNVVMRKKGIGDNSGAARAFGAILCNQLFWYLVIHVLMIVFGSQIMHLFTSDEQLIADALQYYYPLVIAQPLIEAGLCLERGFRTDGRAAFFSVRGPLTCVLNLAFNCVAIFVFDGGIMGLAIAAASAQILGYCWSGSHFFSKKCTIRPDLSVLRKPSEVKDCVKEEIGIGIVYAIDDSMFMLVASIMNARILAVGGAVAIVDYGILSVFRGFFSAFCIAVQTTYVQLSELFYSDKDYASLKLVFMSSVKLEFVCGILFSVIVALSANVIVMVYAVESIEAIELLPFVLLVGCLGGVFENMMSISTSFFVSTRQNWLAKAVVFATNAMVAIGVIIGSRFFGIEGLFIGGLVATLSMLVFSLYRIGTGNIVFGNSERSELTSFSYVLSEETVSESSTVVYDSLLKFGYDMAYAFRASMVTEECNLMMLYRNREVKRQVSVDLRLIHDGSDVVITLIDNGEVFNPYDSMIRSDDEERLRISRTILKEIAPGSSYSRVLDLNVSHLYLASTPHVDDIR